MDPVDQLQRVVEEAQRMIASVRPHERARPTPCQGWDVNALVNHMIGACARYATVLQEASPGGGSGLPEEGFDQASTYAGVSQAAMREWRAPGALDRTVTLAIGPIPARAALWLMLTDQTLHSWDLAKATGRPYRIPDDLAAGMLDFMHERLTRELRGPGKPFGLEVECPEDAPLQDRVVACSGRQP